MKRLFYLILTGFLGSCATSLEPTFHETRVLERIGDLDTTPHWADGSKVMWEENNQAVFANIIRMTGDARPDACMKASALAAKGEMLQYIRQNITISGQLDESSLSGDPSYESLTAFLSQGKIHGVKILDRYWEKTVESNESGESVLRLRCATKVALQKSELQKQLREAANPKGKGNAEIRNTLLNAQKSFIDNLSIGH